MSSQSILVSWQSVEAGERNGIITSYTIEYRLRTGESSFGSPKTISNIMPKATNHLLTQLRKYKDYEIKVSASTKMGSGPFSNAKFERTSEDGKDCFDSDRVSCHVLCLPLLAPDDPPAGVRRISVNSTFVALAWDMPSQPNGIIRRYEVSYIDQTSSGLSIDQWKRRSVTEALARIDDLSAFTVYVFRIRAFTVGFSQYSSSFLVITLHGGEPYILLCCQSSVLMF